MSVLTNLISIYYLILSFIYLIVKEPTPLAQSIITFFYLKLNSLHIDVKSVIKLS